MPRTPGSSRLDDILAEHNLDGFLQFDNASNPNQRYISGFEAEDDFIFLRRNDESILVVPPLEMGRAEEESQADIVRSTAEFVTGDVRGDTDAEIEVMKQCLSEYGINRAGVPRDFPLYVAEQLNSTEVHVEPVPDTIVEARKPKGSDEIGALETAQSVTERAMAKAEQILRDSEVKDDVLYYEGEVLTAERLREEAQIFFLQQECQLDEAIVACGPPGADPHYLGTGPLKANQPILLDIYPEHESGYWGDMTRTFVKGAPEEQLLEMYDATLEAFNAALDVLSIGSGVSGGDVHNAVCDVFEENGYPTVRDGDVDEGFLHSTGHAIGLDLHEQPRLVTEAESLDTGYVLTIEPGLYDQDIGGVRIEDMIVVTENGYRNLNDYHTELIL